MVSAPLIVLLYDRTFLAGSFREAWLRRRWVHGALFASWILLGYLVVSTGGKRGSISTGLGAGVKWWDWILTQFPAICHYLRLCFWPRPLVFEYGTYWVLRPISVLPQGLAVGLLAGGTLWALWRRPAIGFLGFWFFAILAPTTLVAGTLQMVVEHRMYLALIPVVVLFVLVTYRWMGRGALPFCLLIAAGLFGMTLNRNETYHSAESIWSDTVAKRPENALAHYMLGWYWYHSTPWRLNDAIAQIEEALRLKPDYFEAHMTLGIIRSQMPGRLDEAVSQFEEAVRLRPNLPNPHFNLGVAWLRVPERLSDAIAQFEIALQQKPDFPEAHYFLAVALSRLPGCREQEKAHLNEVLRLKPDDEPARRMLGGISESQR